MVAATDLAKQTSTVYAMTLRLERSRELTSFGDGIDAPSASPATDIVYIHTTSDNFYSLNMQNGACRILAHGE